MVNDKITSEFSQAYWLDNLSSVNSCKRPPFSRMQPFLSMNKLGHFRGKAFLGPPLFWLFDMQLHYVVNLWKGQKSEELQVPWGQKITCQVYIAHLIFISSSFILQRMSCLLSYVPKLFQEFKIWINEKMIFKKDLQKVFYVKEKELLEAKVK